MNEAVHQNPAISVDNRMVFLSLAIYLVVKHS